MSIEPFHSIEQQLAAQPQSALPADLRAKVIGTVHRQLASQHWERRAIRFAAALLAVGIGLNWSANLGSPHRAPSSAVLAARHDSVIEVAVAVAEATDAETGRGFARYSAALGGSPLSKQQAAEIEQEIERRLKNVSLDLNEG